MQETSLTERDSRHLLRFVKATCWIHGDTVDFLDDPSSLPEPSPHDARDPLAIFFTSGTQSLTPKPCLHSHQTLLANAAASASDAGMGPYDCFISGSPFTHLFGMLSCHLAWVLGARQVLLERFRPPEFLAEAARHHATAAFLVPTHVQDLLEYLDHDPNAAQNITLREIRVAGAAVPPDLARHVKDRLGVALVNHWGMSEIGAGTYTQWQDPAEVPEASIGRPCGESRLMLVDIEGSPIATPHVTGEMLFRGPSLFHGYYGNDHATENALCQDQAGHWWLRTGDLAFWDDSGRLHCQGRLKDIVNRGGMKIDALEIERAVLEMAGVRAAALVAEPDARLGERAALVIEAHTPISLDMIRDFLATRGIAKFKWPERLEIWDRLPRTPTGKMAKGRIRERLLAGGGDSDAVSSP